MQKETIKFGKNLITYTVDRRGLFLIIPATILLFLNLIIEVSYHQVITIICVLAIIVGFFIMNKWIGVIVAIAAFLYYTFLYILTYLI